MSAPSADLATALELIADVIGKITQKVWAAKARRDMVRANELIIERGEWVKLDREMAATFRSGPDRWKVAAESARERIKQLEETK